MWHGRFTVPLAEQLGVSVVGVDPSQKSFGKQNEWQLITDYVSRRQRRIHTVGHWLRQR